MFERPRSGERALLVRIGLGGPPGKDELSEFEALARSAGADVLRVVTGTRRSPDPRLYIGSGKAEEIRVSIIDHGTGMDGDFVRNRLFQPFASTKPGGFGIGSFEARSLIATMGGRLVVHSTPGVGSEFSIFLPAAEEAAQPQRKRA